MLGRQDGGLWMALGGNGRVRQASAKLPLPGANGAEGEPMRGGEPGMLRGTPPIVPSAPLPQLLNLPPYLKAELWLAQRPHTCAGAGQTLSLVTWWKKLPGYLCLAFAKEPRVSFI